MAEETKLITSILSPLRGSLLRFNPLPVSDYPFEETPLKTLPSPLKCDMQFYAFEVLESGIPTIYRVMN